MEKILIPVDGSPCSLRAVEHTIARRAHCAHPEDLDIHLVHVEPPIDGEVAIYLDAGQLAAIAQDHREKAFGTARHLLDAAGARYTCHHAVGHVAEAVTRLAESLGCDQITMGTHGRGALADLLLGSTTLQVIHLANLPVLLVK
jgi:nucleotide-binding universal stress UspA family protein